MQILDYEGVPFRCRRCHRVGHIFKEFPLIKKPEDPLRAPTTSIGTDAPALNRSPSSVLQPLVNNITSRMAKGEHRMPSPPLTRARVAVEAAKLSGIPLTSYPSSFAYSSSLVLSTINTSMAHCTLAHSLPSIASTTPSLPTLSSISISPSSNWRYSSHNCNLRSHSHIDSHPTHISGLGLT